MRKIYYLALVALVGIAFSSCNMLGPSQPEYRLSDLQGLWLENGDTVVGHHVRFTTEQSDETGYLYGREWNDNEWYDEGSYEEFLIEQRERQGYPGNGWFKYLFETTGSLTGATLARRASRTRRRSCGRTTRCRIPRRLTGRTGWN